MDDEYKQKITECFHSELMIHNLNEDISSERRRIEITKDDRDNQIDILKTEQEQYIKIFNSVPLSTLDLYYYNKEYNPYMRTINKYREYDDETQQVINDYRWWVKK